MAFATINYYSHSLKRASSINVVFPDSPAVDPPWSAYYLLHGLSDDHTTWSRRSCIERYVLGYPLMIVMPNGGRGWYTNAVAGEAFEDDLLKDVVGLVETNFPVKKDRKARAIGGISMGGFGAVKLGLKHPDLFASVDSQSGVLGLLRHPVESRVIAPEFDRIFGEAHTDGPEDPYKLAADLSSRKRPALLLQCGQEDPFLPQNHAFREHLDAIKFPHDYRTHPGTHAWRFWDHHLRDALDFHRKALGIPDDLEHEMLR